MESFLLLGATFGLTGVALGAFGSHALRTKLPPERVATFETGIQYQMWHALALFLIILVDAWEPMSGGPAFYVLSERGGAPLLFAAGWSFAAGIVLFSGSLYAFADAEHGIEEAATAGDLERAEDLRLRWLWAPLGTDDPAGARIRRIAFENLHELTMDESGETAIDPPAAARLDEIEAPTLVLPADHDPPWHERICIEIAESIRGARVVRIPETDHVIPLRRPEQFNHVVLGFLGEVL